MLTPCLWFDTEALDAAKFYIDIFPDSKLGNITRYLEPNPHVPGTQAWDVLTVEYTLMGIPFMGLNGGPYFKKDPSISFFVNIQDRSLVDTLWSKLLDDGVALMPLAAYDWSEYYGWIQDKYGVSWQLYYRAEDTVWQTISPLLAFTKENVWKAEEAIAFYTSIFPNSSTQGLARYMEGEEGGIPWQVKHGQFRLHDTVMMAMDASGPHDFTFSCGISFLIPCRDQEEIDFYYDRLSAVPEAEQCGWLADKYGVSWQLNPVHLEDLMKWDSEKAKRVMQSLLSMKRLDIGTLEKA